MKKFDYYIRDLSGNRNDPAFEAFIPKANTYVFGESFDELQKGIELALESGKTAGKKYRVSKTVIGVKKTRVGKK